MRAGRVVAIVVGCILGILGLGLVIAGIAGTVAYGVVRDDDGYFRTDEIHLSTPTSAITSASLDLGGTPGDADWITGEETSPRSPSICNRPARVRSSSRGSDLPTKSRGTSLLCPTTA